MVDFAANLRRLMARQGLTVAEVVRRSGLDERTVKAVLSGNQVKPRAATLHQLASGLDVPTDELFQNPSLLAHRLFDRKTNHVVDEFVRRHPTLFEGWSQGDFDELYSRFGAGGALTHEGAREAVESMNRGREVHEKVAVLLESSEGELLKEFVELLYKRVLVEQ